MDDEFTMVSLAEQQTAVTRGRVAHDGIADFLGAAFGTVIGAVAANGAHVIGPPFARYRPIADTGWEIEAGFPVDGPVEGPDVEPALLPGGRAAQAVHQGSYDSVAPTWQRLESWVAEQGHTLTDEPWECYLDGPDVPEPRTLIVMPCRPSEGAGRCR